MDCSHCSAIGIVCETNSCCQYSEWINTIVCNNCNPVRTWYVCRQCERKSKFTSTKQLAQHHFRCHKKKKLKINVSEDNDSPFFETTFLEVDGCNDGLAIDLSIFQRDESQKYIYQELEGNGAGYLVSRSCFQFEMKKESIDPEDIKLHLRLAHFCHIITRNEREMFASLLKSVIQCTKRKHDIKNMMNNYLPTEIPITVEKFRSTYSTGEHSLMNNLPFPLVKEIQKHAYVSLREVLQHFLAIQNPNSNRGVRFTKNFTNICSRARKIHSFASIYIVIEILEWSDDFEPNHLKNNRGSVWIKTITLRSLVMKDHIALHQDAREQTFAVALGPKGECHDQIEHEFSSELESLCSIQSKYFFEGSKSMVPVYAELSLSLQDQPERRSANYLLGGNSTMHGRWGYSADIVALSTVLPPCERCWEMLKKKEIDSCTNSCSDCTNWSMDVDTPLLDFMAPDEYPQEELSNRKMLHPKKITYSELASAVNKAREKLENKDWSYSNAEAFLGTYCITKSTISDLLEASLYRRQLNEDDDDSQLTSTIFADHPEYFVDKTLPPPLDKKIGIVKPR